MGKLPTKYSLSFTGKIKSLISEDKDKYLALASLENLKSYLPANLNTDTNIDLLPIAFSACNVNRFNLNDDGINTQTALSIADTFVNKPIDLEHDRNKVIGVILSAGFCEFGSEKPLTREEVKDYTKPFNICLGGVIWKVVDEDVADAIEDSSDPDSPNYLTISASWELGFEEYDIVLINGTSKNLEDGKIAVNQAEAEKALRANGGSGTYDGSRVYRLANKGVLAVGIGLTENPAAKVEGVLSQPDIESLEMEKEAESKEKPIVPIEILADTSKNEIISVNTDNIKLMDKISSLKDITDESLKTIKASAISDFVIDEVKKVNDAWTLDKTAKDTETKLAREKAETLATELKEAQEATKTLKAEFDKLNTIVSNKEKQDKFNQRMASFDSVYNLSDEDRSALAAQIKDLDDTSFASLEKTLAPLMKEKRKDVVKTIIASEKEKETVIDKALDNSEKLKTDVLGTSNVPKGTQTMKEKYAGKFGLDNITITHRR